MPRKIIDISIPLENGIAADPDGYRPKIMYFNHQETFSQMQPFFPGLKNEDLPDGEAWAIERVELSTHNGTHLDAPYHFHSTMNKGKRAITIDEVPLDWYLQNSVKYVNSPLTIVIYCEMFSYMNFIHICEDISWLNQQIEHVRF